LLLAFVATACASIGKPDPRDFEREYYSAWSAWAAATEGWNIMLERDNARVKSGKEPWFNQSSRDRALQVISQGNSIFIRIEPYVQREDEASRQRVDAGIEEIEKLGGELDGITKGAN
jgi:hypothetical protein